MAKEESGGKFPLLLMNSAMRIKKRGGKEKKKRGEEKSDRKGKENEKRKRGKR